MVSENNSSIVFEGLLFPKIFRTFRMAIQPTKLIIIFSALIIICLAGWIMDHSETVACKRNTKGKIIETELQIYMANQSQIHKYIETNRGKSRGTGVFSTLWHFTAATFQASVDSVFELKIKGVGKNIKEYFKAAGWALRHHFIYCIIFFVIYLCVISIAGGAICRIAALQFARGEKPGLTEALRFSTQRFTSFFLAPLTPIGIIIVPVLFIFILGLIGNIPWVGELIIGISMPLALIAGALITVVLIGMFAGFNLMFPAVAYDGSDCFDSISRSFSYVYAKPWRMGFYTTIAAVYGAISYTFVRLFSFILLFATHLFLELGILVKIENVSKLTAIWPKPTLTKLIDYSDIATTNWTESIAAFLVYLFLLAVVGLVVSFIISFYFSANTIIYSLMRYKVDNTAIEDMYTYFDETEIEPVITDSKTEQNPPV
ncbi:MAG: hypothetical protein H8D56_12405 [Planctomycetes bacterium]|nr:hypothetical protein [Planctomycetota bacterium]MBL7143653.1 hypothetical protein [Phycisphaerae bacterium]